MIRVSRKIMSSKALGILFSALSVPGVGFAYTASGGRTGAGFSSGGVGVDVPVNNGIGYFVVAAVLLGAVQLYFRSFKDKAANNISV